MRYFPDKKFLFQKRNLTAAKLKSKITKNELCTENFTFWNFTVVTITAFSKKKQTLKFGEILLSITLKYFNNQF